jgi:hypothetical protein
MDGSGSRMRWFRTVALPLVAAGVLVAAGSSGSIIPGGGPLPLGDPPFTDCYVYANAAGTLKPNKQKFLVCEDGNASCDQDRTCNGVCVFTARLCEGLSGSSAAGAMVSGCEPPPGLDRLRVNGKCPIDAPSDLSGSACGAFVTFEVPLKGRRQQKRNRARCTARAAATVDGRRRTDSDVYVFTCVPRPGGCPASPSGAFVGGATG